MLFVVFSLFVCGLILFACLLVVARFELFVDWFLLYVKCCLLRIDRCLVYGGICSPLAVFSFVVYPLLFVSYVSVARVLFVVCCLSCVV